VVARLLDPAVRPARCVLDAVLAGGQHRVRAHVARRVVVDLADDPIADGGGWRGTIMAHRRPHRTDYVYSVESDAHRRAACWAAVGHT
jgi:hypothetical protein